MKIEKLDSFLLDPYGDVFREPAEAMVVECQNCKAKVGSYTLVPLTLRKVFLTALGIYHGEIKEVFPVAAIALMIADKSHDAVDLDEEATVLLRKVIKANPAAWKNFVLSQVMKAAGIEQKDL